MGRSVVPWKENGTVHSGSKQRKGGEGMAKAGVELVDLGRGVLQLDLHYMGRRQYGAGYVLEAGGEYAIVDPGASSSVGVWEAFFAQTGIPRERVAYVLVTHIHLDHAGGAGLLLQSLPRAKVVVHPRGAKHLVDPSKLIASAREVYGEAFDRLFAPVVPIDAERVLVAEDGFTLELGGVRTLRFIDSPGHAYHHYAVHDERERGLFCGDASSLRYPAFLGYGVEPYIPSSSPTHFDPAAFEATQKRFAALGVDRAYVTHFGMCERPERMFARTAALVWTYVDLARAVRETGGGWEELKARLWDFFRDELAAQGVPRDAEEHGMLELDMELNAKGLMVYLDKQARA